MHSQLQRFAVQTLLAAGLTQAEVAAATSISARSVRRIGKEAAVDELDDLIARRSRKVGRPSTTAPFRGYIVGLLDERPDLPTGEVLRLCRGRGYDGGHSALYALVRSLRPKQSSVVTRFEGLPGEFCQHDFGEVVVTYVDGRQERIHFFASRMKWSRAVCVSVTPDQTAESLARCVVAHAESFGGLPLRSVFDRPRTIAVAWTKAGVVTQWSRVFAEAMVAAGFVAELCWPYSPQQKGSVENLVGWVKSSFFKVRRFVDHEDLLHQLGEWHTHVNEERPSRATGVIPAERLAVEQPRLRPLKTSSDELAFTRATGVDRSGYVSVEGTLYSVHPDAAGLPATVHLHRDRVRVVAGTHTVVHARHPAAPAPVTTAEHRAAQVRAAAGPRGKRYLRREHLLHLGPHAERFLTEVIHAAPDAWSDQVDQLHQRLQQEGPEPLSLAIAAAVDVGVYSVPYVLACLGPAPSSQEARA